MCGAPASLKQQVKPCVECPWRTDVPTGKFPPARFIALANTAYDMNLTQFACHKSPEGSEIACAGFLLVGAAHNLGVRWGIRTGKIDLDVVSSDVRLFSSFRAMAVANGVPPQHPALHRCRDDGLTKTVKIGLPDGTTKRIHFMPSSRPPDTPKHPGRTPAQRRVLDQIGAGNFSPQMTIVTRDTMLVEGLIEPAGERRVGEGPFAVVVKEYQMPIGVHFAWCAAVAADKTDADA